MGLRYRSVHARRCFTTAIVLSSLLVSADVHAGTKYWDINGAASGAGSTSPSGLWDTGLTTNWTTNSAGAAATTTWAAGDSAIFSAGADATGPFTVSLSGAISVRDITVQEGTLTLTGGSLSVAANAVQWDGGAGLTINSAVLMNGKTLSTTGLITLAGPVTIDNKLSIIGGTTTLAGDNTGTGGVRLNTAGASLVIASNTAMGDAGGVFEWGDGTLSAAAGSWTLGNSVRLVAPLVNFTGNGNLGFNGNVDLNGADGTFNITGPGVLTFAGGVSNTRAVSKTGTGTLVFSGTSTYSKTTTVNDGSLLINGYHSGGDAYTVTPNIAGRNATLGGSGVIAPLLAGKSVTLSGSNIGGVNTYAVLAPGAAAASVGTLTIGSSTVNTGVVFNNLSRLAIDLSGANADRLTINGNLSLTGTSSDELAVNVLSAPTLGRYTLVSYTGAKTDAGATGFTNVTGLPTGYRVSYDNFTASNGAIDLVALGSLGGSLATAGTNTVIRGGSLGLTLTVQNTAPAGGDALSNYRVISGSNVTGVTFNGGSLAAQATGTNTAFTFNSTGLSAGANLASVTLSSTDSGVSSVSPTASINVLDHAAGLARVTSGNNFTVIVGATGLSATVSVSNTSGVRSPLQVSALPTTSTGSISNPGQLLLAAGASTNYTVSFNAATVGTFNNAVLFQAGDQQSLAGASALSSLSANISGTVLDHAAESAAVNGNGFTVITGGTVNTTISLSNSSGTRSPLQVSASPTTTFGSLSNPGQILLAAGTSTNYSLSFTPTSIGSFTATSTFTAGDQQSLAGALALGSLRVTTTGTVLGHAAPSLTQTSLAFGNILKGVSIASTNVSLANGSGSRANLVLTNVLGAGSTAALTRTGTNTASLTAGSSLLSSFGLTTSSAGAFTASYAFDVEDQALPGAADLPTQTINLSANVFNPANLVVNLSGPKVTIANQAGSYVAAGQFTSASLALTSSSGWSIVATGPLDLAADSSVRDIATFDSTHLLNGTHRNAITLVARNDPSLIGSAPGDVINRSYSLAKTVSGNAGLGIANAAHAALLGSADGGSYAGFGYGSGNTGGAMNTVATILDGTPSTARIIEMYFMARTTAALIEQSYLYSDVLHLSGVGTDTYVLQMSYDPARVNGGDVKLGYRDSQGFWVNAVLGNIGGVAVNQRDGAYDPTTDFHLGYYGFDSRTNTVWAVLNHNSEFAVIPEPASFGLLAIVAVALIRRRRRVTSAAA